MCRLQSHAVFTRRTYHRPASGRYRPFAGVLQRLVAAGNTVMVVEHNLELVKAADWVIDLGLEGGAAGGKLIAQGTLEQIAQAPGSYTGQSLKEIL